MQLSYAAADYEQLGETARARGDLLSYTAARLLASQPTDKGSDHAPSAAPMKSPTTGISPTIASSPNS